MGFISWQYLGSFYEGEISGFTEIKIPENLSKGLYLLKIQTNEFSQTETFVKF